jgi:hypothetical protein
MILVFEHRQKRPVKIGNARFTQGVSRGAALRRITRGELAIDNRASGYDAVDPTVAQETHHDTALNFGTWVA